jgi:hypothetical protein
LALCMQACARMQRCRDLLFCAAQWLVVLIAAASGQASRICNGKLTMAAPVVVLCMLCHELMLQMCGRFHNRRL